MTKTELPKWFNGELYTEGAEVTNRFGGDSCYLNAEELSMYDFTMSQIAAYENIAIDSDISWAKI